MPRPRRRRRTQKERSAETRGLLLEATVECLAELGYTGATSQVIAERAGVSRGAQLHHFGSKMTLVIQAMDYLFERRLADFREGYRDLPRDVDTVSATLDLLWSLVAGPSGYAYLELVMAARTDPDLRAAMRSLTKRMDHAVEATFAELFESTGQARDLFTVAWTGVFALMEGLAIERIVRPDDERLDEVLVLLKRMAPMAMRPRSTVAPLVGTPLSG
jgi:AcrR family transcriptional regulator